MCQYTYVSYVFRQFLEVYDPLWRNDGHCVVCPNEFPIETLLSHQKMEIGHQPTEDLHGTTALVRSALNPEFYPQTRTGAYASTRQSKITSDDSQGQQARARSVHRKT